MYLVVFQAMPKFEPLLTVCLARFTAQYKTNTQSIAGRWQRFTQAQSKAATSFLIMRVGIEANQRADTRAPLAPLRLCAFALKVLPLFALLLFTGCASTPT